MILRRVIAHFRAADQNTPLGGPVLKRREAC